VDGAVSGLVALGLVVVAVVAFGLRRLRLHSRSVDELARTLGGTRRGSVVTFALDGREYRCECFRGGRHQRPWIELRTDSAPGTRYSIVRTGGLGGIGERFGRGERVATGDPELDRAFRLYSPTSPRTSAFFSTADRRSAVRGLFDLGATEVDQDDVEVSVRWANRRPDADLGTGAPGAGATLGRLAEGTPALAARTAARRFVLAQRVGASLFVVVLVATGFLAGLARDRFQVLDWSRFMFASLWYSVPVAVGLGVWAVRTGVLGTVRQRPTLLGIVGTLVLVPYLALEVAMVANGWLDEGPATSHDTRVLHEELAGGRHREYQATVASWRGAGEERLSIGREVFARLRPGMPFRVVTKPGWFGYEWVVHYEIPGAGH
jgi:hypothetical protein